MHELNRPSPAWVWEGHRYGRNLGRKRQNPSSCDSRSRRWGSKLGPIEEQLHINYCVCCMALNCLCEDKNIIYPCDTILISTFFDKAIGMIQHRRRKPNLQCLAVMVGQKIHLPELWIVWKNTSWSTSERYLQESCDVFYYEAPSVFNRGGGPSHLYRYMKYQCACIIKSLAVPSFVSAIKSYQYQANQFHNTC